MYHSDGCGIFYIVFIVICSILVLYSVPELITEFSLIEQVYIFIIQINVSIVIILDFTVKVLVAVRKIYF